MLKNTLYSILVFVVFCLASIWSLSYISGIANSQISANNKIALNIALKEVLPTARSFNEIFGITPKGFQGLNIREKEGFAFLLEPKGYLSKIKMVVGVDKMGMISGIKIIDQKETQGLGAGVSSKKFLNQFIGKSINDPIEPYVDIMGVTGATISSRGVCQGAKEALSVSRALSGRR